MRQHLSGVSGQEAQQLKFDGSQLQLLISQKSASGGIINLQVPVRINGAVGAGVGTHHGEPPDRDAETREQFFDGERFRQVVVGPRVQRSNLVFILTAGADDDDRHIRPASDLPDHVNAVHIRKPEIQKDHVRVVGGSQHDGFPARRGGQVFVIMSLQCCNHEVADGCVVLNDQDDRFIH